MNSECEIETDFDRKDKKETTSKNLENSVTYKQVLVSMEMPSNFYVLAGSRF